MDSLCFADNGPLHDGRGISEATICGRCNLFEGKASAFFGYFIFLFGRAAAVYPELQLNLPQQ